MPRERLSLRQAAFAELYVSLDGNGTEAARRAGYGGSPERRAYENLKNPLVQAEIERIRVKQQETASFTVDWWRREVLSLYRKADAAGDRSNAARALEMAGKHLGLQNPDSAVRIRPSPPISVRTRAGAKLRPIPFGDKW